MLERMQNVLKNRKAEGDKGFSLVELAVVIVIIGILVAIAVPVFGNITKAAENSQVEAAAANGAAIVASNLAVGDPASDGLAGLQRDVVNTVAVTPATPTISNFCVTATPVSGKGDGARTSGPGANAAGTACTP